MCGEGWAEGENILPHISISLDFFLDHTDIFLNCEFKRRDFFFFFFFFFFLVVAI